MGHKMATIVGDVTGLQQRRRLSAKGKIVLKYCNIKSSGEGFHKPLLVQLWGYEFKLCTSG